jgi:thiol:disulfide interchange protein DsbD
VALSVDGAFLAPMIGMLGFSVALAGPFTLFALFPRWLDAMPKSGGWMNAVKVTLGILELAFALKFLSVADLAYGWHILDREVFLSLWIVLFSMLGLYYIGKIRFAHEAELKNVSFFRFFLALLSFAFAIYMLPGLWGAPLKAVSAFAPPLTTQDFKLGNAEGNVFYDYDEGMAYARQHDKKVFLDFSGYGCVNCRKMEAAVFADAEVKKMLNDNFVVVTLYVDDRTALPQEMEVQENGASVRLQTQGEKWSFLQRYKFGTNAQPYYVVLDKEGKTYGGSFAYNESVTDFVAFLRKNLEKE